MRILNINLKHTLLVAVAFASAAVYAQNDVKNGSAGGTEVMMNPWAKSSGYAGAYVAGINGVEAMRFNVAGISDSAGINFAFGYTEVMLGSGTGINAFGMTKSVGKTGTLGLSIMANQLGDFIETTEELPEGTGTIFSPNYINFGIAYAKKFSESINGGILVRVVNESIQNVSATGVLFDAGIQYQPKATENSPNADKFRFGVSLQNVGSSMQFTGDGLSDKGQFKGKDYERSLLSKSESFELPTSLSIGLGYDAYATDQHLLTLMGTYKSNSYTADRFILGTEYTFNRLISLRVGFDYYDGLYDSEIVTKTDAQGGPTAGISVMKTYGDTGRKYAIDYAYKHTSVFGGTHSIGLSFDL